MLNFSTEFRNEIYKDNRNYLVYLDITLVDGTVLSLTNDDIWNNSFKINDSTSESNKFTIGAAVSSKMNVILNNIYDKFSEYDFCNAIVIAYVGMQLSETLEKVRVGTYIVDTPSYDGSTISLTCLDYMIKFNKPYSQSSLTYPATLNVILADACQCCEVTLVSATFDNYNYSIAERPTDDALTFGDVIACVSQIACKFAKIDSYGRLKLGWYDMNVLDANNIDGGSFDASTPYQTGDNKNGGNFTNYTSGDSVDGGSFTDIPYHHIYSTKTFNVSTDDVIITGVKVTEEFEESDTVKKNTVLVGQEGYVIDVSGNVLIQSGQANTVASYLFGKIGGMRFRPLNVETLSDPSIEAGDVAYVTDRKQQSYKAFISNRTFQIWNTESISCDAESPLKNSEIKFSSLSKALVKERQEQIKQMGSYELAVKQLTDLMTQAFGVFKTSEKQADGSIIYYMHNKPTLATSDTVWKMTADAFAVSTDGGKTWTAGIDSSGNAVVNVLNAVGINADWIKGGTLEVGGTDRGKDGNIVVKDANNNLIMQMDINGLNVKKGDISGTSIILGGTTNGIISIKDAKGAEIGHLSKDGFAYGNPSTIELRMEAGGIRVYNQGTKIGQIILDGTMDGDTCLDIGGKKCVFINTSKFVMGTHFESEGAGSNKEGWNGKIEYVEDIDVDWDTGLVKQVWWNKLYFANGINY